MSTRGLFDLLSGDDLCAKLEHDFRRVSDDPSDAYAAFDFVVTAWHLLEWRFPGESTRRKELCELHPILRVCEHLAVGAKHYEPTNPKLDSVQASRRDAFWAKGVWAPGMWAQGFWKDDLVVELTGTAKAALGDRLTILEMAVLVMEFWRGPGECP
jgi:hypothetical protein